LLGVLEEDNRGKAVESSPPKKQPYQFGRPKTPEIKTNKSTSMLKVTRRLSETRKASGQ
jgi:hypothetical protein